MNNDDLNKCPKCGYNNAYIGAISIECGYDKNCENFSTNQAKEVARILKEKDLKREEENRLSSQCELDWDDDEIITKQVLPLYFSTTDD